MSLFYSFSSCYYQVLGSAVLAFGSAAMFACHPVHVEVSVYIQIGFNAYLLLWLERCSSSQHG